MENEMIPADSYIEIKEISYITFDETDKINCFFENGIYPELVFSDTAHIQKRLSAYSLLKESLELFFPGIKTVKISYNNNGKLYLENELKSVYVNLSHSHNYIMCGISNYEIGVDIQKTKKVSPDLISFLLPIMTEDELDRLTAEKKTDLWCKAESMVKAQGKTIFDTNAILVTPNTNLVPKKIAVQNTNYSAYYTVVKPQDCI